MLSEADSRVLIALFSRISHAKTARPFMVGWVGDEIRFSIQFSTHRPTDSLIAAARLAATIGVDTVVYSFEAVTSKNVDANPRHDPEARECIMGLGWRGVESTGWFALLSRADDGDLSYEEPHRLDQVPAHIDGMIRSGLEAPDNVDELSGWLADWQHNLHIYPS